MEHGELSTLHSGISRHYKATFALDEDSVRRIQAVLEKAAQELKTPTYVVFHVEREDDRFYESVNINDILSDPNIKGKKIRFLEISLMPKDSERFAIPIGMNGLATITFAFTRNYGSFIIDRNEVGIRVSSPDRNWALLLADALEPQVTRTLKANSVPRWLLASFLVPLAFLATKVIHVFSINSNDWPFVYGLFVVAPIILFFFIKDEHVIRSWLGPDSAFLWGDGALEYAQRVQFQNNVTWVVIIGFIISFVSSGIWLLL